MRISKLMLPAVTVAGALALAGCGGGSGGTTTQMGSDTTDCTDADGNTFKIPGKDAKCPSVNTSGDKASEQALIDARALRFKIGDAFGRANSNYFSAALNVGPAAADQGAGFNGGEFADADHKASLPLTSPGEEIGASVTINSANSDLVGSGVFGSGPSTTHAPNGVYDADGEGDDPPVAAYVVQSATFDGVSGTVYCTGICTSARAPSRESFTLSSGAWTFVPGDPKAKRADAKYAEYGWWRKDFEDNGGAQDIAVFHEVTGTGAGDAAPTSLNFGGTATYEGKALGLYAVNVGPGEQNDTGNFEATAKLNATFGTDPTLEGTVDGFKVGSDKQDRSTWKLELVKTTLAAGGMLTHTDAENSVKWTIGNDTDDNGRWDVQMFGEDDKYPGYALGSFGAIHDETEGRIIGTFGVEHQKAADAQ
ncbi:MAG: hypothetical protein OXD36_11055 [Rhodobacter sp.]|nr:hypothetical protein [Rhodobacter sp.]